MHTKFWLIIKDDATKTFEVCNQASNDNAFSNKVYAMQKAGMSVTAVVLPVTNKNASKDVIKFVGYIKEDGLYERLLEKHRAITAKSIGEWLDTDDGN